jgi:hypothetical protein
VFSLASSGTPRATQGRMRWFVLALVTAAAVAACGTSSSGAGQCGGLSLNECRQTAGCKPDTCFACLCDQSYRGCLAESQTPAECPALGCPGAECCSTQAQCTQTGGTCSPPGTPFGCGACSTQPGTCTTDAECKPSGQTLICEPIACSCTDQKSCVAGCTKDADCAASGEICDTTSARCVPRSCTTTADCAPNFDCTAPTCARRSCTTDLDCDGYCVNGSCFDQTGTCILQPP